MVHLAPDGREATETLAVTRGRGQYEARSPGIYIFAPQGDMPVLPGVLHVSEDRSELSDRRVRISDLQRLAHATGGEQLDRDGAEAWVRLHHRPALYLDSPERFGGLQQAARFIGFGGTSTETIIRRGLLIAGLILLLVAWYLEHRATPDRVWS